MNLAQLGWQRESTSAGCPVPATILKVVLVDPNWRCGEMSLAMVEAHLSWPARELKMIQAPADFGWPLEDGSSTGYLVNGSLKC